MKGIKIIVKSADNTYELNKDIEKVLITYEDYKLIKVEHSSSISTSNNKFSYGIKYLYSVCLHMQSYESLGIHT